MRFPGITLKHSVLLIVSFGMVAAVCLYIWPFTIAFFALGGIISYVFEVSATSFGILLLGQYVSFSLTLFLVILAFQWRLNRKVANQATQNTPH